MTFKELCKEKAATDGGYAIALALLEIAETQREIAEAITETQTEIAAAQRSLAVHLKYLGVGDAGTTMGAIEYLATVIKDKE